MARGRDSPEEYVASWPHQVGAASASEERRVSATGDSGRQAVSRQGSVCSPPPDERGREEEVAIAQDWRPEWQERGRDIA